MSFSGGDIAAMRALATHLSDSASRLDAMQRLLTQQLNGAAVWRGSDAERFRQEWNGREVPRMSAVSSALTSAADTLRQNADEQEQASRGNESAWNGAANPLAQRDSSGAGIDVAGILSRLLDVGGVADDLARLGGNGLSAIPSGVLFGAGVVTSLTSMVEGMATSDNLQTSGGVIGLFGSALGRANSALGIAATAASLYGELTLPTSNEDIDGVFDAGARSMFGKDADTLNDAQQAALNRRYDGLWGVANMISDSMDHKAAEAGNFFKGLFGR